MSTNFNSSDSDSSVYFDLSDDDDDEDSQAEDAITCPITCDIFQDPVIDPDGNTYEKSAILSWLQTSNGTSPITRAPLRHDQLVSNRALLTLLVKKQELELQWLQDPLRNWWEHATTTTTTAFHAKLSEFLPRCPITGETITEPVTDPEGFTYEKAAIDKWLSINGTSPITDTLLFPDQLIPNRALNLYLLRHQKHTRKVQKQQQQQQVEKKEQDNDNNNDEDEEDNNSDDSLDWDPAWRKRTTLATAASSSLETTAATTAPQQPEVPRVQLQTRYNMNNVLVRIHVSEDNDQQQQQQHPPHTPTTIVLVLDISGSSLVRDKNNNHKSRTMTLTNMFKHASCSVIETLQAWDHLAIITFTHEARILLPFTNMNAVGKHKANQIVSQSFVVFQQQDTRTTGTNLYSGLRKAMQILRLYHDGESSNASASSSAATAANQKESGNPDDACPTTNNNTSHRNTNNNSHILLFTDGKPNIHPKGGEIKALRNFRKKYSSPTHTTTTTTTKNPLGIISTFGLGCYHDSALLNQIATVGQGFYSFIPRWGCVGTITMDVMANILSIAVPHSTLRIENNNSSKNHNVHIDNCISGHTYSKRGNHTISIQLPPLIYGQTVDVLFTIQGLSKVWKQSPFRVSLRGEYNHSPRQQPTEARLPPPPALEIVNTAVRPVYRKSIESDEIRIANSRCRLIRFLSRAERCYSLQYKHKESKQLALENVNGMLLAAKKYIMSAKKDSYSDVALLDTILEDMETLVPKAYNRGNYFYTSYGTHYIKSLARSHILQQCCTICNKDSTSIQMYALQSNKFTSIRKECEQIWYRNVVVSANTTTLSPTPTTRNNPTNQTLRLSSSLSSIAFDLVEDNNHHAQQQQQRQRQTQHRRRNYERSLSAASVFHSADGCVQQSVPSSWWEPPFHRQNVSTSPLSSNSSLPNSHDRNSSFV